MARDGLQGSRSSRDSRKQHSPQRDRIAARALPPTSGKAKLRVVNASSDNTSYDACIDYGKALPGLAPATGSAYQELDSGTYVLSFTTTGSTNQVVTLTGRALDAAHV